MKNYVMTIVMLLGMIAFNSAHARPHISNDTPISLELTVDKEKTGPTSYNPVWIIERENPQVMQKFIWIPKENGESLIVEANSSALLRLAWNTDTYKHDNQEKSKTN